MGKVTKTVMYAGVAFLAYKLLFAKKAAPVVIVAPPAPPAPAAAVAAQQIAAAGNQLNAIGEELYYN